VSPAAPPVVSAPASPPLALASSSAVSEQALDRTTMIPERKVQAFVFAIGTKYPSLLVWRKAKRRPRSTLTRRSKARRDD
jgi:hypothetical protein